MGGIGPSIDVVCDMLSLPNGSMYMYYEQVTSNYDGMKIVPSFYLSAKYIHICVMTDKYKRNMRLTCGKNSETSKKHRQAELQSNREKSAFARKFAFELATKCNLYLSLKSA